MVVPYPLNHVADCGFIDENEACSGIAALVGVWSRLLAPQAEPMGRVLRCGGIEVRIALILPFHGYQTTDSPPMCVEVVTDVARERGG